MARSLSLGAGRQYCFNIGNQRFWGEVNVCVRRCILYRGIFGGQGYNAGKAASVQSFHLSCNTAYYFIACSVTLRVTFLLVLLHCVLLYCLLCNTACYFTACSATLLVTLLLVRLHCVLLYCLFCKTACYFIACSATLRVTLLLVLPHCVLIYCLFCETACYFIACSATLRVTLLLVLHALIIEVETPSYSVWHFYTKKSSASLTNFQKQVQLKLICIELIPQKFNDVNVTLYLHH